MVYRFFTLILTLILLFSLKVEAQSYQLTLNLHDYPENSIILGYYSGERMYIYDTIIAHEPERFSVHYGDSLLPGMYLIADNKAKVLLDFFVDENEDGVEIDAYYGDVRNSIKIKSSEVNSQFYSYIHLLEESRSAMDTLQEALAKVQKNADSVVLLSKIDSLDAEMSRTVSQLINADSDHIFVRFMRAQEEIEIPDSIPEEEQLDYYRRHYFDSFSLDDIGLLRTSLYHQKLAYFMEKLVVSHPDSVLKYGLPLIEQAKGEEDTYRYVCWYLTRYAESSKVMGMDAAFVALIDAYFSTGEMDFWLPESAKTLMIERANTLRNVLLGTLAPEMIMMDTAMVLQSMHEIETDFTLLLFWDTECGHCKKEIPKIVDSYTTAQDTLNFQVFAVCSDTSMVDIKNYIKKYDMPWITVCGPRSYTPSYYKAYDINATPVLYLLDSEKKIIAKQLLFDKMLEIMRQEKRGAGVKNEE